jgi:hypothetical protein
MKSRGAERQLAGALLALGCGALVNAQENAAREPLPQEIVVHGFAGAADTDGGAGRRECVPHNQRSLRSCLGGGNRYVRITSDLDIEVSSPIILDAASSDLTLDGRGHNVTLRVPPGKHHHLFALKRQFDNLIIVNVRLVGNFDGAGPIGNDIGLFEMDGDPKNNMPITRVALINSTFKNDPDGAPQPWCGNRNVTFDGILVMDSYHPFGHGCAAPILDPDDGRARNGITTFRSVFARNGERQPQLREGVYNYDFVRNIVYDWRDYDARENEVGGYGLLLRDGAVDSLNIVGNAFLAGAWREQWGCVVGTSPGPDKGADGWSPSEQALLQRDIFFARAGDPGENVGGLDCHNFAFKRSLPNPRPYVLPEVTLHDVLDNVGAHPRTPDEQALIDEIRARLARPPASARSSSGR